MLGLPDAYIRSPGVEFAHYRCSRMSRKCNRCRYPQNHKAYIVEYIVNIYPSITKGMTGYGQVSSSTP